MKPATKRFTTLTALALTSVLLLLSLIHILSRMIKVELPIRLKGPSLRFQRPLRFLVRMVVRLVISPRSRCV